MTAAVKSFESQLASHPEAFLYTAHRGLWAHVGELGGRLRRYLESGATYLPRLRAALAPRY